MRTVHYERKDKALQKVKEKNENLTNYASGIHSLLEDKEDDFHKEFSSVLEDLSTMNINDIKIDNSLNIEGTTAYTDYSDSGGYQGASNGKIILVKNIKNKITYADIMAKTDMLGLKDEFKKYKDKQEKKLGKKYTSAEILKLKQEWYKAVTDTSFDHTVYTDEWRANLSKVLDFIPVIGGIKNIGEAIAGKSITGEHLSSGERVMNAVLGSASIAVDAITLGHGSGIVGIAKVAAKETIVRGATMLGTEAVSTGLQKLGLPPEIAFVISLGITIGAAYVGGKLYSKYVGGNYSSLGKTSVEDGVENSKYIGSEYSAFGDMSPEDGARYSKYWDEVASGTHNLPGMDADDYARYVKGINRLDEIKINKAEGYFTHQELQKQNILEEYLNTSKAHTSLLNEGGKYSSLGGMSDVDGIKYSNWMKVKEGELNTDYVQLGKNLAEKIKSDGYHVIRVEDATIANADWYDMGFDKPPIAEGTTVFTVQAGDYSYSRVYLEGYNNPMSSFIVRTDDISGLNANEIAQKLALPQVPNKIVSVELPPTTPIEVSITGPQVDWGTIGGDVQFAIKDVDINPKWFTNIKDLK
ncbi:MAG: pre-toxin TG domain-containing protein [Thomasclavelia sp.]|nr:pre-toxin TG domain-containing protein [Thomasclavelia sp.]